MIKIELQITHLSHRFIYQFCLIVSHNAFVGINHTLNYLIQNNT